MNIIEVSHLTKKFGKKYALNDVSFAIKSGSVTGFLGPNGAGKSTTINILLGFLNATSGAVTINGRAVKPGKIKTRVGLGFLSNNFALDKTLTVGQELKYLGHLNGKFDKTYAMELAKRLNLDWDAKIGKLSTGNYQKVALVSALQHRPAILILDEPTNGLDPLIQNEFGKLIAEFRANGATIFISSHILSEVQELCDEFVFIREGKIAAQITKFELSKRSGEKISIDLSQFNDIARKNFIAMLEKYHLHYQISAGDLNRAFMQFYEGDNHA
ncbi:ABC transporter ATP-binding protein [Candidatus Saccharibacteria bacterium]|nr:ABC transporter ATP-binding protein [Candidatus Saccharibacteria bacterium]MCL1963290.1 ABC transporter ATP-binding protein [Candidatus Saccharibacteria bacterium]